MLDLVISTARTARLLMLAVERVRVAKFNPGQARDDQGQWTTGGAGFAQRAKELRVPPGWTAVKINMNAHADLLATGKDSKGRTTYLYSVQHAERAAAEKFSRLKEFHAELPSIRKKIAADLKNPAVVEEASVLTLIDKTGFRVGSDSETGAETQAYGASTLRAKHVSINGDKVTFNFVGKKGVNVEKVVEDKGLVKLLVPRVKAGGRLFETSDTKVRDYLHSRDGEFKVKDFRTWHGTNEALRAIRSMDVPKTDREYKVARREVGRRVASYLGNTPTVALNSYIDPGVWGRWKKR